MGVLQKKIQKEKITKYYKLIKIILLINNACYNTVLFFIFYDVQKDHYVQNINILCTNYLVLILSEKVLPTLFPLSLPAK